MVFHLEIGVTVTYGVAVVVVGKCHSIRGVAEMGGELDEVVVLPDEVIVYGSVTFRFWLVTDAGYELCNAGVAEKV